MLQNKPTFGNKHTAKKTPFNINTPAAAPINALVPPTSKCPGQSGNHQGLFAAVCMRYVLKAWPAVPMIASEKHIERKARPRERRRRGWRLRVSGFEALGSSERRMVARYSGDIVK